MAAPDFTLIRGGQVNQAGDDRALFLKQFGGEVFTAFEESNVFLPRHMVRTITKGKSAQFPSIGGKTASYHTPGVMITGVAANLAETVLTIDAFLYSASAIADIDQAMSHFDYRQPFSQEDGRAIARQFDQTIARLGVQAAQVTSSRLDSGDIYAAKTVGKIINSANADDTVADLKAAMREMSVNFDEKDIPETDRSLYLKPLQYALLASDNETISSDYGGAGKVQELRIPRLYGFDLVKTNNLPTTNVTGTYGNKYNVDARNTVALAMHPWAVGTLKVRDLAVSMTGEDYHVTHNATLVKSQMLYGSGVLRPEGAGVIRTAAPA